MFRLSDNKGLNLLENMMRKLSWMLLVLLVLVGCGNEVTDEEGQALKVLDKDEVFANAGLEVVANAGLEKRKRGIVWKKDGKEMVLIPAGSFEMGDSKNELEDWMKTARPVHTVELDAFYMDVHEVTVGQFREFVEDSGYDYQENWANVAKYSPGDGYPMVYVTWNDATAYAKWAGKRLSTEAEWEYAARGGLAGKRYPWGDEITHDNANYEGIGGRDQWIQSSPVGSFEANGYGLYDMTGNAMEWCQDRYGENYYSSSPAKNPSGPGTGSYRVLRGGIRDSHTLNLRVAVRYDLLPNSKCYLSGFRCVSGSDF